MSHPRLIDVYEVEEASQTNRLEIFGFLMGLATYSAKQLTDGIVGRGVAYSLTSPDRADLLLRVCEALGLLGWVEIDGQRKIKIFTSEDFIHLLSKAEVEARRNRSRENRDPKLKSAVIYRDGDLCRYCGVPVRWTGPIGFSSGTLDHVDPTSVGSATVDKLVVACHQCNSSRQDARAEFDEAHPLREVPAAPYYSQWSAEFLNRNGYEVQSSLEPPKPISSDAQTTCAVPGEASSVDPEDTERAQARRRVDPGETDHLASVDPHATLSSAPSAVEVDPGEIDHLASVDPSREDRGTLPPPAVSPNRVRTESELSPDSSPTVRGIKANSLGSGRVGSGSNRVETGQRPGRAETGSGRDRVETGQRPGRAETGSGR
ncbi:HNH endonuclease, partial [uncultured Actinomyces sp.]|uniref:HNH endonuclease n=1 Tax=uncultured Actinomyces sp. TaxID=249061 RepID=UPI0025ED14CB